MCTFGAATGHALCLLILNVSNGEIPYTCINFKSYYIHYLFDFIRSYKHNYVKYINFLPVKCSTSCEVILLILI